jgi:hypothetical protein
MWEPELFTAQPMHGAALRRKIPPLVLEPPELLEAATYMSRTFDPTCEFDLKYYPIG